MTTESPLVPAAEGGTPNHRETGPSPGWRASLAPTELAWRRPRHELWLLVLVATVALLPVVRVTAQDESRLCLTKALADGRLTVAPCIGQSVDQARYHGRKYSDKAPGLSALAVPAAEAVRLPDRARWNYAGDAQVWAVRLLTSGVAFVLLAFAVGRVSEGLAPGWGGAALVTFALGTLVASLAPTMFGHVPAAALAFGAFVLAWRRLDLLAGLAAGAAIVVEYQAGVIAVVVGAYVLLLGLRPFGRYALGALPPLLLLAAYDWAAFGSPFHLSYHYIANEFAAEQSTGFFGIGAPHLHSTREVLVGSRGLLVISPIAVAAAAGLVLLWRSRRAEALAAAIIVALFVLLNCGYFLPYGGTSPGPRFLVPALPFLALGLGPAFARWRVATSVLAVASIAATTAVSLTWSSNKEDYRLVWKDVPHAVTAAGRTDLVHQVDLTALSWAGPNRLVGAGFVVACAAAAFSLALLGRRSARR